jgi:serine/threonine protein kinase
MLKCGSNMCGMLFYCFEFPCQVLLLFLFFLTIMLIAFAVMHDLRLIHTDLKPENILLVSSDYVKVPDYKDYKVYSCGCICSLCDLEDYLLEGSSCFTRAWHWVLLY